MFMSLYELETVDIDGNAVKLEKYKGKTPSLIVNVASFCGYTHHYSGLQELYERYSGKIEILGFPCNQFGKQEPGSHKEIKTFCESHYSITFPLFSKIDVKGSDISPVYQYLNEKANDMPKWNFHKYLVDREGNFVASFGTKVKPLSEKIVSAIDNLLV